jgi:DNA-binding response OmpR family regulator
MQDNKISQTEESAGAPLPRQRKPAHRILVVEDDLTICQLNADVLRHFGYQVDAAEDGAAAWDTLQRNRYDLMVTDNDMPKVSGVELLHKLHAAHMALPVILATGKPPQDEFTQYPWLQPAALLLKPYSFHELLGTVQQVLRATGPAGEPAAPPDWPTGPSAGASEGEWFQARLKV